MKNSLELHDFNGNLGEKQKKTTSFEKQEENKRQETPKAFELHLIEDLKTIRTEEHEGPIEKEPRLYYSFLGSIETDKANPFGLFTRFVFEKFEHIEDIFPFSSGLIMIFLATSFGIAFWTLKSLLLGHLADLQVIYIATSVAFFVNFICLRMGDILPYLPEDDNQNSLKVSSVLFTAGIASIKFGSGFLSLHDTLFTLSLLIIPSACFEWIWTTREVYFWIVARILSVSLTSFLLFLPSAIFSFGTSSNFWLGFLFVFSGGFLCLRFAWLCKKNQGANLMQILHVLMTLCVFTLPFAFPLEQFKLLRPFDVLWIPLISLPLVLALLLAVRAFQTERIAFCFQIICSFGLVHGGFVLVQSGLTFLLPVGMGSAIALFSLYQTHKERTTINNCSYMEKFLEDPPKIT